MKFFLDTAKMEEVRECVDLGLIDGVTTNPTLIANEGCDHREVVTTMCDLVNGPVSAEVIATEFEPMMVESEQLATWHEHVVVKVPLTEAGLKTVTRLAPKGIRFNVTLCFSLGQALLAAKAGATFISPFVGRLDDIGTRGMDLIPEIVQMYDNFGFQTEVLVASIRSPLHVTEGALAGAHIATMPYKVFKQLYKHPLTDLGLARFLEDHRRAAKG